MQDIKIVSNIMYDTIVKFNLKIGGKVVLQVLLIHQVNGEMISPHQALSFEACRMVHFIISFTR